MKTPINELIRKIEMMQVADYVVNPLGIIKGIATELLEKEKQMIMQTLLDGFKKSGEGWNGEYPYQDNNIGDGEILNDIEAEQYYNETFKQ